MIMFLRLPLTGAVIESMGRRGGARMNRILSLFLGFVDELLPFVGSGRRNSWVTGLLLIAANATVIPGVMLFGWSPWIILFIYWSESLIIGALNVLRMLMCGAVTKEGSFSSWGLAGAFFMTLFFLVHYGLFMMGHLLFLLALYSELIPGLPPASVATAKTLLEALTVLPPDGAVFAAFIRSLFAFESAIDFFDSEVFVVILLVMSHVVTFAIYFVRGRLYVTGEMAQFFMRPYKRIVLMQLTIIFGAMIIMGTGWNAAKFIVFWVLLKILVDLRLHFSDYGIESGKKRQDTRQ